MNDVLRKVRMSHLLITDSGIGGLSVCAEVERRLRQLPADAGVRITYFNAWPDPVDGYNDMPDIGARARVFDRALVRMAALGADRIVIACNTLSIVYAHTSFMQAPPVPVHGIVGAGVTMFAEVLGADPDSAIVLSGTNTTIESDVHRQQLIATGVAPSRVVAVACHGLARAIETVDGALVRTVIEECMGRAAHAATAGDRLYLGLCCTHFTYVHDAMRASLERACGRPVHVLDPNARLATEVVAEVAGERAASEFLAGASHEQPEAGAGGRPVAVTMLSKVPLDENKRRLMAERLAPISPATASALLAYTLVPDLF